NLLRQALEEAFGDVAAVLRPLLLIEELDEVPHLVLPAGGQRRDLLSPERARGPRRGLKRAVLDLELAGAHVAFDQRRQHPQLERPAGRALQVPEVLNDDRGFRVAQGVSMLLYARQQRASECVCPLSLARAADAARERGSDAIGHLPR